MSKTKTKTRKPTKAPVPKNVPDLLAKVADQLGIHVPHIPELFFLERTDTAKLCRKLGLVDSDFTSTNIARGSHLYHHRWAEAKTQLMDLLKSHGYHDETNPPPPLQIMAEVTATQKSQEGPPTQLFKHPINSIVQWMGSDGWTAAQAIRALLSFGVTKSKEDVLPLLKAGRSGSPVELREHQIHLLQIAAAEKVV